MRMDLTNSFESALLASRKLGKLSPEQINRLLLRLADVAVASVDMILKENQKDLDLMDPSDPKYDRLKLTKERIVAIASDIRNVAALPSPLGRILSQELLPNGLHLKRISVPFGVIGVVFEARPNVTFDVFSLCIKSGNAVILKGGSDVSYSNEAIAGLFREVLAASDVDVNALTLLPPSREATTALLGARGYVDLIIPRGSQALIDYVRDHAKIPVIETGAGILPYLF